MSNAKSWQEPLHVAISTLLDGEADETLWQELNERLAGDDAAIQEYLELANLHALLSQKHEPALEPISVSQAYSKGRGILDSAPDRSESAQCLSILLNDCPPTTRTRSMRNSKRLAWCGLAATVLVAGALAFAWHPGSTTSSDEYIAVLTEVSDVQWIDADPGKSPTRLRRGQKMQLAGGVAEVIFSSGVAVVIRGPADLDLVSPMHVKTHHGIVRARVGEEAIGFLIETPNAEVVDLGTEFGVQVNAAGDTDVVVFEGSVDLAYEAEELRRKTSWRKNDSHRTRRRLHEGEALQVDRRGEVSRIVTVDSELYPAGATPPQPSPTRAPLITGVTDNVRDPTLAQYYQIVRGGLWEDARAYVDRHHQWNGLTPQGIPSFLLGADYVMTFNADKWQPDLQISIDLSQPAMLYLMYDDRLSPTKWLKENFTDTGHDLGVDEGYPNNPRMKQLTEIGPAKSIDTQYSVWGRAVPKAGTVEIGALPMQKMGVSMYGIAAVPLASTARLVEAHEFRLRSWRRAAVRSMPTAWLPGNFSDQQLANDLPQSF